MTSRSRRAFLGAITSAAVATVFTPSARGEVPDVCSNTALLDALRVLHRACSPIECNFTMLRELNDERYRDALLAAFANKDLNAVHVFFPENKSELKDCFDWGTGKKSQLNTFQYLNRVEQSTIYLIGRASRTGTMDHNRKLSAARMQSVYNYLRYDLKVPCPRFRGAWMGKEILQFGLGEASFLKLNSREFRDDELVLNQAVHVFAVPCGDLGL